MIKIMDYYSNIRWVEEYARNIRPYIHVREEDSLLIKIPNEAYKLNEQGLRVLKKLLNGESVFSIIDIYADRERVARDIHYFFCDLRALLKGCYHEKEERLAVEKIPFELPFNTLPVLSEIALTYRCNLSCRFCYASCGCQKNSDYREMSTEDIRQVLRIIKNEAGVPSVSFTGGEPTLRDDLPEIIRFAKSLGMWTNLISNGLLITDKMAGSLKEAGLDSAQISIEAGEESLHDAIVRRKGAFSLSTSALRNLMDEKIRVHTNTTISGLNRDHLEGVLHYVRSIGLDKLSMNLLMPAGAAQENLDEILVTYSEIGDIVCRIDRLSRDMGLEFMWYSPTPICIFNPITHGLGNKGCAACDGLLSIAPDGNILPCSSYPRPMGSILEHQGHFQELWSSPAFAFFQKKRFAHEKCLNCGYLPICNGGCPLYWDQVGYQEILEAACENIT